MRPALAFAALAALVLAQQAGARAPLAVSTSVAPSPVFFGEQVTARAEIVVDNAAVDPSGVRFSPDFTPYGVVGRVHRSRTDSGGVTTLGFVFRLACLNDGCLPGAKLKPVTLPSAHALAAGEDVAVDWPPVVVAPRVTAAAVGASRLPWRVQLALPTASYRVRPGTATAVTALCAALLAALGAGLIGAEVVRRRRAIRERERRLSRLAQALALVRAAAGRDAGDRRKALSLLARVLESERNGDGRLARDAEQLAWARAEPSTTRIDALLREVEARLVRS